MSLGFDDNEILSQSIGENEDYYFISITNNTNLTFDLSVITEYNAFQGYIINDDWNVGCPLESISKIDPYSFSKNPNEILYLRSTFLLDDQFGDIPSKCIWNFVAPDDDYQFKLVVLNFPSDLNTTLLLSYGDNVNQNLTVAHFPGNRKKGGNFPGNSREMPGKFPAISRNFDFGNLLI
uniref:CUB domain-containing protein n=1 Tax=Panagrolaimus superbus TaxID=310955 RepID=A0A914XSI2_9BILA